MNALNKTSRILGVAFLVQFVTSIMSGLLLLFSTTVVSAMFLKAIWFATGNIAESMIKISNNAWLRSSPKC